MNHHVPEAVLLLLILFSVTSQPSFAQTAPQSTSESSREADGAFDAPANDMRLVRSELSTRWDAVRKVMPEYPEEALRAGAQGLVVLSLYQDGEGDAAKIKVVESPHPALTEAAVGAAKQWKWRKFVVGGVGRPILGKLSFRFVIEGDKGRVEDLEDERALRNLRDIQRLRLKATWPDDSSSHVN